MKKLQLLIVFAVLLIPVYSVNFDEGITKKSSLNGQVVDKNSGEPLSGVCVKLTGLDLTVYTDFDGNFVVDNMFPGKYDLLVSMLTYEKVHKEKILVSVGENNYLKVELEPLK